MQGVATAGSVMTSLASAGVSYAEAGIADGFTDLDARSQQLAAQSAANDIKERMLRTLASQRVAYAASGVDISSGTPQAMAAAVEGRAQSDMIMARTNGDIRAAMARYRGGQQSARMRNRGSSAINRAGGTFINYALDLKRRG